MRLQQMTNIENDSYFWPEGKAAASLRHLSVAPNAWASAGEWQMRTASAPVFRPTWKAEILKKAMPKPTAVSLPNINSWECLWKFAELCIDAYRARGERHQKVAMIHLSIQAVDDPELNFFRISGR